MCRLAEDKSRDKNIRRKQEERGGEGRKTKITETVAGADKRELISIFI